MKNSSVNLEIKQEEIRIILEALLFSSSINIGANWLEKDYNKMIAISKKLKKVLNDKTKLQNIVFYQEKDYEDKWTQSVFDFFKNDLNIISLQNA